VREVVIAESPVAGREDVLPCAPDFHAIAEALAHRVVVGREAERDAMQPIFVFGVGMVAVMYVHDPAAIRGASQRAVGRDIERRYGEQWSGIVDAGGLLAALQGVALDLQPGDRTDRAHNGI